MVGESRCPPACPGPTADDLPPAGGSARACGSECVQLAALRAGQARLDALDEQLAELLLSRVEQSRRNHLRRSTAGLPAVSMACEYATVQTYTDRLGRLGTQIAVCLLDVSRSPEEQLQRARIRPTRP